jgi:OmpA-OmpF porin, OOP family
MNKATKTIGALALGLCFALPSLAQTQTRSASPDGPYIGLGLGATDFSLKKEDFTGATATSSTLDQRGTGFKLFGGYRLGDHLAVEAQFASLGEASIRYRNAAGAAGLLGTETYKVSVLSVAAVGVLPLGEDITLFAKAGPSFSSSESVFNNRVLGTNSKSSNAGLLVGVGASYSLTANLSLRAELENYSRIGDVKKAGRSTVTLLSAGLSYRF